MKTTSKVILGVAALLLFVGGWLLWRSRGISPPSPEQRITESLREAEDAARRHSVGGVMDLVSEDFQAGELNKPRLRLLLSRSFQSGRGTNYDVRVNTPRILPSPKGLANERLVFTKASVFFADSGEDIWGSNPITLVMREEQQTRWLILREPRWRVISVGELNLPGGADGF
ncbi:MAG: hypothetical protein H7Z41_11125 [Cytophagales bacterium]|nr:hypothetical protein [Armatimonadota bacterium]